MSFKDLYSSSRYAVPIKSRTSISINGIDLRSFGFELTEMPNISMPPTRQRNTVIDGRSGSIPMGDLYDNWEFTLSGQIVGISSEDIVKKKDALLQWIDIEQMNSEKMIIGDKEFYGLNFELAGAPLYYSQGSVDVNLDGSAITGNSTLFNSFVKPGVTFEVAGDNSVYNVQAITSDTALTLDSNISRADGDGLAYRIERRRYLLIRYSGSSSLTPSYRTAIRQTTVGQEQEVAWNLSISFYTNYPYWIGDLFDTEFSNSASANGIFIDLNGVGTSQVSPKYIFEGVANSPKISTGIYSFYSNFDTTQKARLINNDVDVEPSTAIASPTYTASSKGYSITSSATLDYSNVIGHSSEGSFLIRLEHLVTNDYRIFNWYGAAGMRLYYGHSTGYELKQHYGSETTYITTSNYITLPIGSIMEVSGWWNNSGVLDEKDGITYKAKILVNGEVAGTATALSGFYSGINSSLNIGDTTNHNRFKISELALFNQSLSDEELRSFYYSNESLSNHNRLLSSSTSCSANDILTYDTISGESEFYDSSTGARLPVMENITGTPPILRGYGTNERSKIYLKTSSANTNKLHVVYRPHFR